MKQNKKIWFLFIIFLIALTIGSTINATSLNGKVIDNSELKLGRDDGNKL